MSILCSAAASVTPTGVWQLAAQAKLQPQPQPQPEPQPQPQPQRATAHQPAQPHLEPSLCTGTRLCPEARMLDSVCSSRTASADSMKTYTRSAQQGVLYGMLCEVIAVSEQA